MIESRGGKDSGVPRSAAADRRTIDRLPRRGRLRAQPRRAGADLPRVDAVRPGAAPGRGAPQLGRHRRRGACRPGQVRIGGPGCASGARGPAGLVGRVDAAAAGRAAGGRPGSRLLDVVGYVAVAADLRCRRPAPAPGDRGAHLRRPAHRWAPRSRCRTRWRSTVSTSSCPPAARRRPPGRTSPLSSTTTPPRAAPGASGSPPTAHGPPASPHPALPATAAGEDPDAADASARGTASELVLFFYGRIPLDSLKLDGDRRLFDQLIAWDPDE